jgi:hypothetical protein
MAILVDREVIDLRQTKTCLLKTVLNCQRWKACPMLCSTEPLLLGRSNENPITKDRCGGVGMKGIETEYDQKCPPVGRKTQKFFEAVQV